MSSRTRPDDALMSAVASAVRAWRDAAEAESEALSALDAARTKVSAAWLAMALACIAAGRDALRDAPEYQNVTCPHICRFLCFACAFSPGESVLEEDGSIDHGSNAWADYAQQAYALDWLRPEDRTRHEEQVEERWAEDAYIDRGGGDW